MSLLSRIFGSNTDPREHMRPLWHKVVELGRDPDYYRNGGVADSVEGRFDMITAVMALVLRRMERDPELLRQSVLLTELFVEDMDGQMRNNGVGDVVVGKHMGKMMGTMGGRLGAYRAALADDAGEGALTEAVERNMSFNEGASDPARVAAGLRELAARLDRTSDDEILAARIAV